MPEVHTKDGLVYFNLVYGQTEFIGAENHLLFVSYGGAVMNQSGYIRTYTEAPGDYSK